MTCCADPSPVFLYHRLECARCGSLLTSLHTLKRDAWAEYLDAQAEDLAGPIEIANEDARERLYKVLTDIGEL